MPNQYKFEFIRYFEDTPDDITVDTEGFILEDTATFTPTQEDSGKTVKVKLTVVNNFGQSVQEQMLGSVIEVFLPPIITGVDYDGIFLPGNDITITDVTIEQGEAPISIEYQFINNSGDILQDWSTINSYQIKMSDLGSTIEVNIRATDAGGRVSATVNSELELVVATVNLDLEIDVDSDGAADIDDEDKLKVSSDVTGLKKWILKYKR